MRARSTPDRLLARPLALAAWLVLLWIAGCASTPPMHDAARVGNVSELELLASIGQPVDLADADGRTPLHYAAAEGHLDAVDWLLASGANIEARDNGRRTPLRLAARQRRGEVVGLLLARGANPNVTDQDGRTPLWASASQGDVEVVSELLAARADPDVRDRDGRTALYRAVDKGHTELVRILLANGADAGLADRDGRTALYEAVDDGSIDVATLLLAANADPNELSRGRESPVMRATERRDVAMLRVLLAAGADPDRRDQYGVTPLMGAVLNRHTTAAEVLLEAGAEPDVLDSNRRTPLLISVEGRALDLTRALLENGASSEIRGPNRMTPLGIAVRGNDLPSAELLLKFGADPDSRDQVGNPPVFVAVLQQQPALVELLLAYGAHPALRGINGRTPLELANELGARESAELLREAAERMTTSAGRPSRRVERPTTLAGSPSGRVEPPTTSQKRPTGWVERLDTSLRDGDFGDLSEGQRDLEEARREALLEAREAQREAQREEREAERDARRAARENARKSQEDLDRELQKDWNGQPGPDDAEVDWTSAKQAAGYGFAVARRAIAEAAESLRRSMEPYPGAPPPLHTPPGSDSRPGPADDDGSVESSEPPRELDPVSPSPEPAITRASIHEPFYSRRVAIVIGINEYQHWPALEGATSDARRVSQAFRDLGFDDVVEIYDRDATRVRLLTVLGNELARKTDDESLAMIYFAGHGQTETLPNGQKRGYIIPVDGDREQVYATGISMDRLRDLSNRLPAKQVYYAMDSCYSGLGFTRGISLVRKNDGYVRKVTSMRSVQMITAGLEGEQALEVGGQGLFTTYFLRALEGEADFDSDGYVTASEIGTYVRPQVTAASRSRQTPQFGTLEGQGEVVFSLPTPESEEASVRDGGS